MKPDYQKPFGGHFRAYLTDAELEAIASNPSLPSDLVKEVADLIQEGFTGLTRTQQLVVKTLFDGECTEREAAQQLGMDYSTFRNHLTRARKKLKKYVTQNLESGTYSRGEQVQNEEAEDDYITGSDESY